MGLGWGAGPGSQCRVTTPPPRRRDGNGGCCSPVSVGMRDVAGLRRRHHQSLRSSEHPARRGSEGESRRRSQEILVARLCHRVTSRDPAPPRVSLSAPRGAVSPAPPACFLGLRGANTALSEEALGEAKGLCESAVGVQLLGPHPRFTRHPGSHKHLVSSCCPLVAKPPLIIHFSFL